MSTTVETTPSPSVSLDDALIVNLLDKIGLNSCDNHPCPVHPCMVWLSLAQAVNVLDYLEANPFGRDEVIKTDKILHGFFWTPAGKETIFAFLSADTYRFGCYKLSDLPADVLAELQSAVSLTTVELPSEAKNSELFQFDQDIVSEEKYQTKSLTDFALRVGLNTGDLCKMTYAQFRDFIYHFNATCLDPDCSRTVFSTDAILHGVIIRAPFLHSNEQIFINYLTREFERDSGYFSSLPNEIQIHLQVRGLFPSS